MYWILLVGYAAFMLKASTDSPSSLQKTILTSTDRVLNILKSLSIFQSVMKSIEVVCEGLISWIVNACFEGLKDTRSDSEVVATIAGDLGAFFVHRIDELERATTATIAKLTTQFENEVLTHKSELAFKLNYEIEDYRKANGLRPTSTPSNDSPFTLDKYELKKLWSCSSIAKFAAEEPQYNGYFIEAVISYIKRQPKTLKLTCHGREWEINPYFLTLLSPQLHQLHNFNHWAFEIATPDRMNSLLRVIETVCGETLTDPITLRDLLMSINLSEMFGMCEIREFMRTELLNHFNSQCVPDSSEDGSSLREWLVVALLNLRTDGTTHSDIGLAAGGVQISMFSDSGWKCLSVEAISHILADRKFHAQTDLIALKKLKDTITGNFSFFNLLDVKQIHASQLALCKELLTDEEYSNLLTAVLENIQTMKMTPQCAPSCENTSRQIFESKSRVLSPMVSNTQIKKYHRFSIN